MTFDEIVTAVQDRLNLTSPESTARIGRTVNDRYKRATSSIGLNVARRTTVQANAGIGSTLITFFNIEKIINVVDRSVTPYRVLTEQTVETMRGVEPSSQSTPTKYAIFDIGSNFVTIMLDCLPQTAFTLYADGLATAATLSGTQEPAFSESYHDVLYHGALADEYRKLEKPGLAKEAELMYEQRLSDLRMFIAKSSYLDITQGGNARRVLPVGSSGASSGSVNGALSYTQTGLISFDRTGAAAGLRYPFAVAVGSEKVVNLDVDKLDGLDSSAFDILASDQTITGLKTFNRGAAAPFAVAAASLKVANLDADKLDGFDSTAFFPAWQSVTYNAGNFAAAGGGTWTVDNADQVVYKWRKYDTTLQLHVWLGATSIAGAVSSITIAIPGGFIASRICATSGIVFDNSASVGSLAYVHANAAATVVTIQLASGSNFAASANATYVVFQLDIETTV